MDGLLKFGDVFIYKEEEYVYLAQTADTLYAAKILNPQHSKLVSETFVRRDRNQKMRGQTSQHPLYCFVMLSTEGFQDRMASFYKPYAKDPESVTGTLNAQDIGQLIDTIVDPASPIPFELKELVSKIEKPKS